jgi:hypothetical protein
MIFEMFEELLRFVISVSFIVAIFFLVNTLSQREFRHKFDSLFENGLIILDSIVGQLDQNAFTFPQG